jgi:hypothetical protein
MGVQIVAVAESSSLRIYNAVKGATDKREDVSGEDWLTPRCSIRSLMPRYSAEYRALAYDDRSSNSAHEPTSGSWLRFCLPMLFAEPAQSDTLVDQTIEMMTPCFAPNCAEPPHNVVPVAGILSKA